MAKKQQTKSDGRTVALVCALIFGCCLIAGVMTYVQKIPVAGASDEPSCAIQFTQDFNHVVYTGTWSGGYETGTYPYVFGDASASNVLTGTEGSKVMPHDYGWNVGDIITLTAGFTVTDALEGTPVHCEQQIVIDDRADDPPPPVTMTEHVYLSLILNQKALPSVDMFIQQGSSWNNVEVHLIWSGGNAVFHTLYWGDGATVDLFGADGNEVVTHYYASGDYTITFSVTGPGGTMSVHDEVHLQPSAD